MAARRFIIYGAGSIGGVIGAELVEHGSDVVLIARGQHYETIAAQGLRYVMTDREVTLKIPVVDHPSKLEFRDNDVVIVTVKSQHTASVMEALYRCAPPQSIAVVCLQNGVANEDTALRYFGHVYGISISSPTEFLTPGVVVSFASPVAGVMRLARYPHGEDSVAEEIGKALDATRYDTQVYADVRPWKYAKLLENLVNVAQALIEPTAGSAISTILKGEGTAAALGRRASTEALAAFAAAGIEYTPLDEFKKNGSVVKAGKVHGAERVGASMHQSLTRGLDTVESDYINGEIVRLGHLHGIPTPVNAFMQFLSYEALRKSIPAGSIPEEEFLRQLEEFESHYVS